MGQAPVVAVHLLRGGLHARQELWRLALEPKVFLEHEEERVLFEAGVQHQRESDVLGADLKMVVGADFRMVVIARRCGAGCSWNDELEFMP